MTESLRPLALKAAASRHSDPPRQLPRATLLGAIIDPVPTHTTACPRNCYSTCGMRVTVADGRITSVHSYYDSRDLPHFEKY